MKKLLGILFVTLLFVALLPTLANAEIVDSGTCGMDGDNLTWTLDDEGILTISGTGEMANGSSLFPADMIKKVVFNNGVTNVGDYAFDNCTELLSVTLSRNTERIGYSSFEGCKKLIRIIFPASLKSIDDRAFYGCTSLKGLELPASLTTFGEYCFSDCTGISEISIQNGIPEIGEYMFNGCTGLTSIEIPGSVNIIHEGAFKQCNNLKELNLMSGIQMIERYAFQECGISIFDLPDTLTTLYISAFNYPKVTNMIITLPDLVKIYDSLYDKYGHLHVTIKANCGTYGQRYAQRVEYSVDYAYDKERNFTFESLSHNEKEVETKAPTCSTTGLKDTICSDCGEKLIQNEIVPIVPHDPVSDQNGSDPTCLETGLTDSTSCLYCGMPMSKQEIIPALGHNIEQHGAQAANCTEIGWNAYETCSRCDYTTYEEIAELGHDIKCHEAKAATCTETGWDTYDTCNRCDYTTFREIPAKGHTEAVDKAVEATCTNMGLTEGKHCSTCEEVLVAQQVVPAKGHTEVIDKAVDATCTKTGLTEGRHCSVCEEVLVVQEVIPAKGHIEVADEVIPATCTESGLTEGKHCSVCGEVLTVQEVIPAKGHTEVVDKGVAPSCTEAGLTEGKHCSVCNEILTPQEEIPASGHDEVIDTEAVEASCTEKGYIKGSHCKVCGEILSVSEEIPAKGHTEVIDEAVEPTYDKTGLTEGKHCLVCGEVMVAQEIIAMLTPTATPKSAATPEPTPTATPKPTATPAVTPTPTATPKPTVTPAVTPTPKATPKPTATPAVTPTPTATPTITATPKASEKPTEAPVEETTDTPEPVKPRIDECKITVEDQVYTGKALKPAVTVKYGKVTLKKGTDYTVAYKDNVNAGTATVMVTGKGNYTGSKKVTFKIAAVKLAKCTFAVKDQTYTGKALKPAVTVKYGKVTLKKGTDYTVTYKNNKAIGTATATVKGKGNYTGSKKVTFRINPKGTAFAKLTGGKQQITLKWKNPKNITGYEIEYSLKKNFSGKKTVKIKNAKTLTTTIKKLAANKTYYVRIRTYTTVKKKNYYSAWSKIKAVKTKTGKASNAPDGQNVEAATEENEMTYTLDEELDGEILSDEIFTLLEELPQEDTPLTLAE